MHITVRYYGRITHVTLKHRDELEVEEGLTLRQLNDMVSKRYGKKAIEWCLPRPNTALISINREDINDKEIFPDWLDTEIKEGDIVAYIGPVSGPA
jgi:molybdopterin converting factor small subunit